jgi:hypothetical protein
MTDCIGEVMAMQQHHEFHAYRPDEAMVPCSQLLSASNAGLHFEHSDSLPEEWQTRLRNLQQCVCDLLIKNQQLRMRLEMVQAAEAASQSSRLL